MAKVRFRVDPNAQERLAEVVDDYMEEIVLPKIVDAAQRIVPYDSGDLQDSIHYTSENHKYYVGADEEYAAHVELGTSKMAAQPYLRPAMTTAL